MKGLAVAASAVSCDITPGGRPAHKRRVCLCLYKQTGKLARGCACTRVRPRVCRLFVLKVRGIAAIASNLKDTALEQVLLQMDLLR